MKLAEISKQLDKFYEGIEGEMFFSSGDEQLDLSNITSTIQRQGYWAGDKYRYYFNDQMDLIKVEERKFGNG